MIQIYLGLRVALDLEGGEEVVGHRHQSIFWPRLEPVNGAARDEPRELEGSGPGEISAGMAEPKAGPRN